MVEEEIEKHSIGGTHILCDMYDIKNISVLSAKEPLEKIVKKAIKISNTQLVELMTYKNEDLIEKIISETINFSNKYFSEKNINFNLGGRGEKEFRSGIKESLKSLGIKILTPNYFVEKKGGLTSVAVIRESSLDIHTYPEAAFAGLGIYTCGDTADPKKGLKYIQKILQPKTLNASIVKRGNIQNLEISLPSRKNIERPFGYSFLIDAYDPRPKDTLNDMDLAYDFLDTLPRKLGFKKISTPSLSRQQTNGTMDGLVGGVYLSENSSADLTTVFSRSLIIFDIFTTKPINFRRVRNHLNKFYSPKEMDEQWLLRGVDYIPE